MFTIGQINDLHARLGSAKTLPEYVRALKELGVERYDSYLADGHSEYFGQGGHKDLSSVAPIRGTAGLAIGVTAATGAVVCPPLLATS